MARTIMMIDIDDSLYREVEVAARRMDISPETYLAVATEQYMNRKKRQQAAPETTETTETAETAETKVDDQA